MKNYYKILEVNFNASTKEITKAYFNLAKQYHPDKNKEPSAVEKFRIITEAAEVLRDNKSREEYDKHYEVYFKDSLYSENKDAVREGEYIQKWEDLGRQKSKEYSSISFNDWAKKLLKEISIGTNYIPNIIAMIIVLLGALTFAKMTYQSFSIIGVIEVSACLYIAYRLCIVARADYLEERKRKL